MWLGSRHPSVTPAKLAYNGLSWSQSPSLFATSPLLIEFLAGIYICRAWLANRVFGQKCAWIAVALGLASIAAKDFLDIQLPRVINSGLPATLIVFGAVSLERGNHVVEIRWLKYLGDSSYSIYL